MSSDIDPSKLQGLSADTIIVDDAEQAEAVFDAVAAGAMKRLNETGDPRVPESALADLETLIPLPKYQLVGKKEATHARISKPKRAAARKRERQNKRRGR